MWEREPGCAWRRGVIGWVLIMVGALIDFHNLQFLDHLMIPTTQHRLALTFLGIALVVLPLGIIPETADPVVPVQMLVLSGLVIGLLAVVGVHGIQVGWGKWSERAWWAFLGWSLLASCVGMVPVDGFLEVGRLLVVTGFGLLCCWAVQVLENPAKWLGRIFSVALIAVGGVGVAQHSGMVTGIPGFYGLPSGTLGNANFYGAALQLLLPGAVLGLRSDRTGKLLGGAGLVVGGLGMYWSGSEAAWLGAGMTVVVAGAYVLPGLHGKPGNWRLGLRTGILLALLVGGLVVVGLVGRGMLQDRGGAGLPSTQDSGLERILLWTASLDIVQEHPVLGCGPDNWNYAILEQGMIGSAQGFGTRYFMQAHNEYVQAFAESGIVGGALFVLFLGFAWARGWRRQLQGESGDALWLSGMALGALSGWMVNAGLSFPLHRPYLVVLLFAWLAVLGRGGSTDGSKAGWVRHGTWALIGLVAVAGVVWNGLKLKGNAANYKVLMAKEALNFAEVARLSEDAQAWYNWEDGVTKTPLTWYQGNALLNLGRNAEAFAHLDRAWNQNPWHPMVANNHAIALAMQGKADEAIAIMEQLLKTFPGFDETRVNLVRLYLATRRYDQAEELVRYWDGQTTQALVNQVRNEVEAARAGAK